MEKDRWQRKGAGHRGRLRDRFLANGMDGFSDAEVLELLLSFGTPRSDCKEPAREALKQFGSLVNVLEASDAALQKIKGIGPKNSFALHFVQGVCRRYLKQRLIGKKYMYSSAAVREYLLHLMREHPKEIFVVIFLDNSHAVLETEVVAEGTVNVNTVYPREIIKRALFHNAAALIVAHNHPSGALTPSSQDMQLTKMLALLCSMMQLTLLDHFIIGDGCLSFADKGLMASIQKNVADILKKNSVDIQ